MHVPSVQEIFDERLQYGFHAVFVLAAMLDPALYPCVHNIPMEQRIKAEELLVNFFGLSKAFANAALGQLKAYREGRHEIPDYAFENPALVADAVGFWKDYGLENPAVKHLAKVAIRVLGIPPTAAGRLELCNAVVDMTPGAPRSYALMLAASELFMSELFISAMQVGSVAGLPGGVSGAMRGTACSVAEWLFSCIATTISGSWTERMAAGQGWIGILSYKLWRKKTLSERQRAMLHWMYPVRMLTLMCCNIVC